MSVIEAVVVVITCIAASMHCVHVFQLGRYQLPVYRQWLSRNRERILRRNVVTGFAFAILRWYLPILLAMFMTMESARARAAGWITLIGYVAVTTVMTIRDLRAPVKKPLVLTMRAQRLTWVLTAMYAVLALILCLVRVPPYVMFAAVPWVCWLGGRIMHPVEEKINAGFYAEARAKLLARDDLIRIGITGSYGKTLTKFILKELLASRYEVLATPASFNTPMGISRVVNDQLEDKHQVFIAEMGAQHVGDIRHLTELVHPKYGVITSIGPQHLDTFGSIANIMETKYELIEGLPEDGAAFFAMDNGYIDRLYARCQIEKYNAAVEQEGAYDMLARHMETGAKGTDFVLCARDGEEVRCHTLLLGRSNVQNIALAAAVARKLGLSMQEIAEGVGRLRPFERRLQLIQEARIAIDDTLNDNPGGAAEALSVLADFPGRRIIVTPGIPAPENKSDEVNFAFGTQMKGCVDLVVLVGEKRKVRPIIRGLAGTGIPRASVHVVADLDDAEDLLDELAEDGDTVLYECKCD